MMPCLTHTFRAWTAPAKVSMPNPSQAKSLPWRRELLKRLFFFYRLTGTSPFLNLSSIAALRAAFRPRWSITATLGWCIFTAAGNINVTAWDSLQKKKKNSKAAFLPACLPLQEVPLLRGNSTARYLIQRLLHHVARDYRLDKYHKNITART